MRQDIYGAMKNAVARGQSLEQVIQSFLSAGYAKDEVMEVANHLNGGALNTAGGMQAGNAVQTEKYENGQQTDVQRQEHKEAMQGQQQGSVEHHEQSQKQYWPPDKYAQWYSSQSQQLLQSHKYPNPQQYAEWYTTHVMKKPQSVKKLGSPQLQAPTSKPQKLFPKEAAKNKRSVALKVTLLSITLVILLGALGASIFYKNAIIEFINNFLS